MHLYVSMLLVQLPYRFRVYAALSVGLIIYLTCSDHHKRCVEQLFNRLLSHRSHPEPSHRPQKTRNFQRINKSYMHFTTAPVALPFPVLQPAGPRSPSIYEAAVISYAQVSDFAGTQGVFNVMNTPT